MAICRPLMSILKKMCILLYLLEFVLSFDTSMTSINEENTSVEVFSTESPGTVGTSGKKTRSPYDTYLAEVRRVMYDVTALIAGIVGTIGNFLSLCVMMRKSMRCKPVSAYLSALAVADTIFLWWDPAAGLQSLTGVRLTPLTHQCNLRHFVNFSCVTFTAYLIVATSVERFIAVYFPLKVSRWSTVFRARVTIVCLALACAAIYSPIIVGFTSRCEITENVLPFMSNLFTVLIITYELVPSVTLIVLSTAIIVKLRMAKKALTRGDSKRSASKEDEVSKVTRVVLVISITFLILTTPYTIFQNYMQFGPGKYAFKGYSALENLIDEATSRIMFFNNAINFFLYVMSSEGFKRELIDMLCLRDFRRPLMLSKSKTFSSVVHSNEMSVTM